MKRSVLRAVWSATFLTAVLVLSGTIAQAKEDGKKEHGEKHGLESRLKGTYAVSRFRACVRTDGDFDEDLRIVDATFANSRTNVVRGHVTFHGDGTGTMDIDGTQLRMAGNPVAPGGQPISSNDAQCNFTYSVNSDNSFTIYNACSAVGTAGPNPGRPSQRTGVVVNGQIGLGGQLLVLGDSDSNTETITISPGTPQEFVQREICVRSGSAVRVND